MADDAGDGGLPLDGALVLEPAQPYRRAPLRLAHVPQQRVEFGGLRVVGHRPLRDGDAGRAAAQAAFQDAGAQQRVEVEAVGRVQQADGVAQPQCLVRAGGTVRQMRLDGGRLLGGTRGQRPGAQQRFEDPVRRGGGSRRHGRRDGHGEGLALGSRLRIRPGFRDGSRPGTAPDSAGTGTASGSGVGTVALGFRCARRRGGVGQRAEVLGRAAR